MGIILYYFPQGTAVFWYNLFASGEGDYSTRHAACPVLVGNKWGKYFLYSLNRICDFCLLSKNNYNLHLKRKWKKNPDRFAYYDFNTERDSTKQVSDLNINLLSADQIFYDIFNTISTYYLRNVNLLKVESSSHGVHSCLL